MSGAGGDLSGDAARKALRTDKKMAGRLSALALAVLQQDWKESNEQVRGAGRAWPGRARADRAGRAAGGGRGSGSLRQRESLSLGPLFNLCQFVHALPLVSPPFLWHIHCMSVAASATERRAC